MKLLKSPVLKPEMPGFFLPQNYRDSLLVLLVLFFVAFISGCEKKSNESQKGSQALHQNHAKIDINHGFNSIRLVGVDLGSKTGYFVATRAVLAGVGNNDLPTVVKVGKKRIIQGMLYLREIPEEVGLLEKELQKTYGAAFKLNKLLHGTVEIAMSVRNEEIFRLTTMTGNAGLPFQFMAENASNSVQIRMKFDTGITEKKVARQQISFSHHQFTDKSSSVKASMSAIIKNSSEKSFKTFANEFYVEQSIDF